MIKSETEKISRTRALSGRDAGFTLVEILVALAIIAVLAGIAFPVYLGYIDKAKITVSISTMETVRKAIEDYHIDHGKYPPTLDMTTGEDGQGTVVLNQALLVEFKNNLFSLDSYTTLMEDYTLSARAKDDKHTLLVLTPGHVIIQGP